MENVVEKLNNTFGNETFNINSILSYRDKLENERKSLEQSLLNTGGGVSSRVSDLLRTVEESKRTIEQLTDDVQDLEIDIGKHEGKVMRVQKIADDYIIKINMLEKTKAYLETLRHIEEMSSAVELGLSDRGGRAVAEYSRLCASVVSLKNSSCSHLARYLNETINYWHSVLKDRFSKEYEEVVKSLKWPFLGANIPPIPSPELLTRFQALSETLIQIQLPETWNETDALSDATNTAPPSLPIALLIRPLKKRFLFHFSGSRQTNQPEKPEWYFTQILKWVKDHQEFVDKHLQPVYDKLEMKHVNARVEFSRGLVQIAMEKLHWDLRHLQYDDALFSHTVDEALGFARELQDGYGYPSTQPSVLSVLTQAQYFSKWIHLEKKYSLEKLDAIMRSESAFQRSLPVDDGEYTTECVDKFLTLLTTITERYGNLPQPGHRLQFLQLQLDLLDDFRVRLLQLLRAQEGEICASSATATILNSLSCLIYVLEEWAVTPHFLQLQYYRQQLEGDGGGADSGVFDDVINLLATMQEDLLTTLTDALLIEAKARSRPYRKDRWHAMDEIEEGVTPSSVAMFHALTGGLCALHDAVTPRLRTKALRRVADGLDAFLFEELVMQAYFSPRGVARFSLDFRRSLLPLFGQYLTKPQAHFPLLSDACSLLTLAQGSALLLKSALNDPREEDFLSGDVLSDVGVNTLNPRQALEVLARRTDL